MRALLVFLILVPVIDLRAEEPVELAIAALDRLDSLENDSWSYTKTTTSNEGIRVERHDATKPEGDRWNLVTIEGRRPRTGEIETYRREKAEELRRRRDREDDDDHEVDRSTLEIVVETPERATYSFRVREGRRLDERMTKQIAGTLVVNKAGWVERFRLESTSEIRPIPGVRMSEFSLELTFRRHAESGEIVPEKIESHVRGRAFLVKSLDDDVVTRFSDFVRVP